MLETGVVREFRPVEFLGRIADNGDAVHPFGPAGLGDGGGADRPVDRLAAGHGHGVVIEDLVGDIRRRRDRLTDRQRAGVIPRPFAEILEDMLAAVEGLPRDPGHALAAHLRVTDGIAIHPAGHDVTADPRRRHRAIRQPCRGVMRTARAEIGRSGCACDIHRQVGDLRQCGRAGGQAFVREMAVQTLGNDRGQQARRQLSREGDQVGAGLVMLADHGLRLVAGPVVEMFLELAFDDAALFLDDQHLVLVAHEAQRVATGQRPDHADLVDVDAKPTAFVFGQAQQAQRLHQVEMALAGGDDAITRILHVIDAPVDGVGVHEGLDRAQLVGQAGLDLGAGQVGGADMQPAGGRIEGRDGEGAIIGQLDRRP